MVRCWRCRNFW